MATQFVSVTVFYAPEQWLLSAGRLVAVPVECTLSRGSKIRKFRLDLATPVWPANGCGPALPLPESSKRPFHAALRAGLEAHLGWGVSPFPRDVVDWEGQRAKSPDRHPWKEDFGKG